MEAFATKVVPDPPLFDTLVKSIRFEPITKGRAGSVLVRSKTDPSIAVPIVRTTTVYQRPAQTFSSTHANLADAIRPGFNNALVELYTNDYTTMGWHSDQAQDLKEDSFIAVFSVYENPKGPRRLLEVASKTTPDTVHGVIPLSHGMVVMWSIETNRRFKHRIVLERDKRCVPNRWFGMTLRTSKTWVTWAEDNTAMLGERPLQLLRGDCGAYYALRAQENKTVDFCYPDLDYTISPSDRMLPNTDP